MTSTSRQPPRWTVPGRYLLVAFGSGQSSQQSTTKTKHQDSHILNTIKIVTFLTFKDNFYEIYVRKYIAITERMNKIRHFAVFHWAKILWKQTFSTKTNRKCTAFVLDEKEWNVDRFGKTKSEQSRTSSTFLIGIEFINIVGKKQSLKEFWTTCALTLRFQTEGSCTVRIFMSSKTLDTLSCLLSK